MSSPGVSIPVLVSAFAFGIVVNAASAALFLFVSGHGTSLFRDGQRLVLATFLSSAALWAQIDFISITISTGAAMPCQIGIIFHTFFDQLGRFSVEQFLLWAINRNSGRSGIQILLPQVLLAGRFVLGAVFVGFSRPQFAPVCIPQSSMLPLAIVVVALDAFIVVILTLLAFSAGMVTEIREGRSGSGRSKSIILVIAAFAVWTAMSVIMLLGMSTIGLLWKTLVPSIGALIIIFVVTACNEPLTKPQPRAARPPESPGTRDINTGLSTTTEESSYYPPSRYEDLKHAGVLPGPVFERPRNAPSPGVPSVPPIPAELLAQPATRETSLFQAYTAPEGGGEEQPVPKHSVIDSTSRRDGSKIKHSLLGFKGERMAISHPILEYNGEQNPLSKIATISLEAAAKNESSRRRNELQRDSALVAKRPAPQPPSLSPEEGLKRAVSLKRKEIASVSLHPSMPTIAGLEAIPVAVTSSSQLSPGVEAVRRRSPRSAPADTHQGAAVPATPSPTLPLPPPAEQQLSRQKSNRNAPGPPPPQTSTTASPEAGVARSDIRPSRRLLQSHTETHSEPPMTILPRQPTNGLPGNPRAIAVKPQQQQEPPASDAKETSQNHPHQTIMFMNNIVYDNPETVRNIIDDVSLKGGDNYNDVRMSGSVVHRPRPIPRKPEEDRALFPAAPSPNLASLAGHRRSKSASSLFGRKSLLMQSHPGSPMQLPPLPPHLRHTLEQKKQQQQKHQIDRPSDVRPHPNDTKSMTFNEKMTLLFPSPPSGNAITQRRRSSSVPDLPRVVMDYMPITISPTHSRMSRSTMKSVRTSVGTDNVVEAEEADEVDEVDELPAKNIHAEEAARQRSMGDGVGSSWLPGISGQGMGTSSRPSMRSSSNGTAGKRASSPVLPPPTRESTFTATSDARSTNWGSMRSPLTAVPVHLTDQGARSMFIMRDHPRSDDGRGRASSIPDDDGEMHKRLPKRESQWHHRVGDDCPTFSDRREKMRLRKMPPPTPLLLGPVSTRNPGMVKAAEPSPLGSPTEALAFIQLQLKKFESSNLSATESPSLRLKLLENLEKEMDVQVGHWHDLQHGLGRDSMSSTQTATPKVDTRHSSFKESPLSQAEKEPKRIHETQPQEKPRKASIDADRKAGRPPHMCNETGGSNKLVATSAWQRRLAEAQTEFVENSNRLGFERPGKQNFLDLSHIGSPTPPDSDESDNERRPSSVRRISVAPIAVTTPERSPKNAAEGTTTSLWVLDNGQTRDSSKPMLWVASAPKIRGTSLEAPAANQNNLKRSGSNNKKDIDDEPLQIESSSLWTMSNADAKGPSMTGLWAASRPQQLAQPVADTSLGPVTKQQLTATPELHAELLEEPELALDTLESENHSHTSHRPPRPLTQRPPRRSRRMTLLPDIIENPLPMPEKRGTLGIFQFPWGERSDTATVQPRVITFMAMPGTMTSGGGQPVSEALEARSRELEASEYSSSFFDDYDDENELDAEVQDSDSDALDSDDGFDENTLWEIASLLKTDHIPSKLSLLPPPLSAGFNNGNYFSDMDDDHEEDEDDLHQNEEAIIDEIAEILVGVEDSSNNNSGHTRDLLVSKLWASRKTAANTEKISVGNPDEQTWKKYNKVKAADTLRPKPRKSNPATVESNELWNHHFTKTYGSKTNTQNSQNLWNGSTHKSSHGENGKHTPQGSVNKPSERGPGPRDSLWAPRKRRSMTFGRAKKVALFDKETSDAAKAHAVIVRTTDKEPAALRMARTPRTPRNVPLPKLQSAGLWEGKNGRALGPQLWAPRPIPQIKDKGRHHLFDRDAAAIQKLRTHCVRTTDKEPSALRMPRASRAPFKEPLPKLTSTSMWAGKKSPTKKQQLWVPRPVPPERQPKSHHLFDCDEAAARKLHSHVRSTDQEPVSANTARMTRPFTHLPGLTIASTRLWTIVEEVGYVEHNWIMAAKKHGKNGSAGKEEKKAQVSTGSDGNATIASNSSGKQPTWWEKTKTKAGISTSATAATAPKATAEAAEAAAAGDKTRATSGESAPSESPTSSARRRPPISASPNDWNVALREAVTASYPPLPHMVASPTQWRDALEEALVKSYPFDATKFHPAFAGARIGLADSLVADVSKVHPAFFSYTSVHTSAQPTSPAGRSVTASPETKSWPSLESASVPQAYTSGVAMAAAQQGTFHTAYAVPEPEPVYVPEVYTRQGAVSRPPVEPYLAQKVQVRPVQYSPVSEHETYGRPVQPIQTELVETAVDAQPVQVFVQQSEASPVSVAPVLESNRLWVGPARSDTLLAAPPSPMPRARTLAPEQEAAYQTYIMGMENLALARLQAMEGRY